MKYEAKYEMRYAAVGDSALLIEYADAFDDDVNQQVVALDHAIRRAMERATDTTAGWLEVVPAFVNLLVRFDPLVTDHDSVQVAIEQLDTTAAHPGDPASSTSVHRVPVHYDRSVAPDLDAVAQAVGLSAESVVAAHVAGEYRVVMYGFAPGYAYLTGVPEQIQVPRKPQPVRDVPAGSVIIAGSQCLITTLTMPTGWSVIGQTDFQVLPTRIDESFPFEAGDRIRFEPISDDEVAR